MIWRKEKLLLLLMLEIEKYSLGLPAHSHVTIANVLCWHIEQINL